MATQKKSIWEEQDLLDKAVEQGAIFTHARTGWKFKLRYASPWSPHMRKAVAVVMAKPDVAAVAKKVASGAQLTAEEEAINDKANIEIAIRGTLMTWSGVTGRDGKALQCTGTNAIMVFSKLKSLWQDVQAFAGNPANYGLDAEPSATDVPEGVEAEGNSADTSVTSQEDSTVS